MKSAARTLIVVKKKQSLIAEQFRTLRTNIQLSQVKGELKTLVVTSAMQEEGKSTIIANLACVFAETGQKVLYIDADLRRPTGHFTFKMNNLKGLSNLLIYQEYNESYIRDSMIENLSILTSGPIPPNPAKLLEGEYFRVLLKKLSTQYDLILIDSPPVLAVSDTQLLINVVTTSLLVVDIEKTQKKQAQKASDILKNGHANFLGLVINNMNNTVSGYYNDEYNTNYFSEK